MLERRVIGELSIKSQVILFAHSFDVQRSPCIVRFGLDLRDKRFRIVLDLYLRFEISRWATVTHHQFSQIIVGGKRSALVADYGEGQLQRQGDDSETHDDLKYPEERAFPLPRHNPIRYDETRVSRSQTRECIGVFSACNLSTVEFSKTRGTNILSAFCRGTD